MKIKTSEATPIQLDWAVARCNGKTLHYFVDDWFKKDPWLAVNGEADQPLHSYTPTTDWGQGGPIIEREFIQLGGGITNNEPRWFAFRAKDDRSGAYKGHGPTPLIAAMRCYVASRLGDEVDVPEELT